MRPILRALQRRTIRGRSLPSIGSAAVPGLVGLGATPFSGSTGSSTVTKPIVGVAR